MRDTHMPSSRRVGDSMPHFTAMTISGERFAYASVWQHKPLVLIVLDRGSGLDESIALRLSALPGTATVVTHESVAGVSAPAAVIADQWGEIVWLAAWANAAIDDIEATVDHLRNRCPECEGESR